MATVVSQAVLLNLEAGYRAREVKVEFVEPYLQEHRLLRVVGMVLFPKVLLARLPVQTE